ncbi:MAG: type II toxin-antitoxin system VapC family toxin [Acidiferrobacteraceae bacterium]
MIVDTSAVIAILFSEPDAHVYAKAITEAARRRMSAATFVEAAVVVEAQTKNAGARQFDAFVRRAGLIIEPVTEEQAYVARHAYVDFGKGRHSAGMNYRDCLSCALAKVTGETLLYKGNDFRKTDIASAV